MNESPSQTDWNAVRAEESFRSARRSAWGSLVSALLGAALLIAAAVVAKVFDPSVPAHSRVVFALVYPSPFLLFMGLIYGLIALRGYPPSRGGSIRPVAIAGLLISGPLCALGAFALVWGLAWLGTASPHE